MNILLLPLAGFLIGLLIISLGGGGGGLYVGILTAFFNIPPAIAASSSLATIIPTTTIGAISHSRAGNVNFRYGFIMIIGAVIGAIAGSLSSDFIPESIYNKITGGLLLVLALQMFLSFRKNTSKQADIKIQQKNKLKPTTILKALIYGFLGGAMSGLVGVSGSSPIVAGLAFLGSSALETVGTSVFVLVGISITGFFIHLGLGNVNWKLVGLLISGTTTGAFLGPILLAKIEKKCLEKFLPPILIVITFLMGLMVVCK